MGAELAWERADLVRSDRDLRDGEARVAAQADLVSRLRASGHDVREAERLLRILRDTLAQWRRHHSSIVERIAYLEARSPSAAPAREGPIGQTPVRHLDVS